MLSLVMSLISLEPRTASPIESLYSLFSEPFEALILTPLDFSRIARAAFR
jgi:hypothetical protein